MLFASASPDSPGFFTPLRCVQNDSSRGEKHRTIYILSFRVSAQRESRNLRFFFPMHPFNRRSLHCGC